MRTATATDNLGGDAATLLRWIRILEDSARQAGGWRWRLRAWELRWYRRRLRRLMTPR